MAPLILIVGAGLVGSLTAKNLKKYLQNFTIKVWDKAAGPGGRMSTSRSPTNPLCTADIGSPFWPLNDELIAKNRAAFSPLFNDGILQNLNVKVENYKQTSSFLKSYVAAKGGNSVINYWLEEIPKRDVEYSHKVVSIDEEKRRYLVKTESGDFCYAEAIVLTIPVPQVLELKGSVRDIIQGNNLLKKIKYNSRFVVVWFYDTNVTFPNIDWACKYMDHDVFDFVSIDNHKRNKKEEPTAVVFHTNVKFGSEYVDKHLSEVENILSKSARELFPDWSEPSSVKYHKWRYSEVTEPYTGEHGCITLKYLPTLILGGDSFTGLGIDGCFISAKFISDTLIALKRSLM